MDPLLQKRLLLHRKPKGKTPTPHESSQANYNNKLRNTPLCPTLNYVCIYICINIYVYVFIYIYISAQHWFYCCPFPVKTKPHFKKHKICFSNKSLAMHLATLVIVFSWFYVIIILGDKLAADYRAVVTQ